MPPRGELAWGWPLLPQGRTRGESGRVLPPTLAAEFDHEGDRVKRSQDLTDLNQLLAKWHHNAHLELRDPGVIYRGLAKAEQIQRTGRNPDAGTVDLRALIQ